MANTLEQLTALQYCCGVAFGVLVWPLGRSSTTRLVYVRSVQIEARHTARHIARQKEAD